MGAGLAAGFAFAVRYLDVTYGLVVFCHFKNFFAPSLLRLSFGDSKFTHDLPSLLKGLNFSSDTNLIDLCCLCQALFRAFYIVN